jgi:hypothetical protein
MGRGKVEWRRGSLTVPEPDAGFLGVDGVEDALVPDLALGSEAYHAPDVRLRRRRGCHRRRSRLGFRCPTHAGLCFFFVPLFCPSFFLKKLSLIAPPRLSLPPFRSCGLTFLRHHPLACGSVTEVTMLGPLSGDLSVRLVSVVTVVSHSHSCHISFLSHPPALLQ